MLATILSAISGFLKLAGIIAGLIQENRDQQIGVSLQKGADDAASLKIQTDLGQIAAQPVTKSDVDKALSPGGNF